MKYVGTLAVLVSAIACSAEQPQSEQEASSIQAKITLPSGSTITQVSYTLTCSPTPVPAEAATGIWPISQNSSGTGVSGGTLGGLDPNDTCTLVLSGQDSWGAAHGDIQNCRGEANGVQVGSVINLNLVCYDYDATASSSASISANVTVSQGTPYQCSGIKWYTSVGAFASTGYRFSLNMEVTNPTAPQTVIWSTTSPGASWYQPLTYSYTETFTLTGNPATDPVTHAVPEAQYMNCWVQGDYTMTLTVQDLTQGLVVNGQPGSCPPSVNTFPITCI